MEHLRANMVVYQVQDMDRAVKFYTEMLGLPLKIRFENHWAEIDAGTISIGLHPTENEEAVSGEGGAVVSFAVEDIESLVPVLQQRGVQVGAIKNPDHGKFAILKDSEGNSLHLIEFIKSWADENSYKPA